MDRLRSEKRIFLPKFQLANASVNGSDPRVPEALEDALTRPKTILRNQLTVRWLLPHTRPSGWDTGGRCVVPLQNSS